MFFWCWRWFWQRQHSHSHSQWQWCCWCWWCWRWWRYKRRRREVGRLGPNLFLSSHISLQGISIHNRLNTAFVNNNCLWQAQATDTNYVFWVGEYFCFYNYYVQQGFPPLNVFANKLMFTSLWKTPFKTILIYWFRINDDWCQLSAPDHNQNQNHCW